MFITNAVGYTGQMLLRYSCGAYSKLKILSKPKPKQACKLLLSNFRRYI